MRVRVLFCFFRRKKRGQQAIGVKGERRAASRSMLRVARSMAAHTNCAASSSCFTAPFAAALAVVVVVFEIVEYELFWGGV